MIRALALMQLALHLLAGCMRVTLQGHTVTEGRAPPARVAAAPADEAPAPLPGAVRELALTFTIPARDKVRADAGFDAEAFRDAVEARLVARRLLDPQLAGPAAEILIDDYVVRPAGSAGAGSTPASASLRGLVRLLGPDAVELGSFPVQVQSAVSIPREGRGTTGLNALYRSFGEAMAEGMAGAAAR